MSKKKRTHTVNYRKKTGRVRQHEPFLNTDTSTKPEIGTAIEIGEAIMDVIKKYKNSPMNAFDFSFSRKFEDALENHKKNENG